MDDHDPKHDSPQHRWTGILSVVLVALSGAAAIFSTSSLGKTATLISTVVIAVLVGVGTIFGTYYYRK
jgi:hypothetical protein